MKTIQQLSLVRRVDAVETTDNYRCVIQNYNDLFTGMCQIADYIYDIKLKEEAAGTIEPCKRIN